MTSGPVPSDHASEVREMPKITVTCGTCEGRKIVGTKGEKWSGGASPVPARNGEVDPHPHPHDVIELERLRKPRLR